MILLKLTNMLFVLFAMMCSCHFLFEVINFIRDLVVSF
jgi:hypothetical protein